MVVIKTIAPGINKNDGQSAHVCLVVGETAGWASGIDRSVTT
jgi:hypothetical protein